MEINLVYNYDIDATRNSSCCCCCCCVCCHCWHCSSSSSAFLISLPVCPRWRLVLMSVCLGRFSDTSSLPDFEMDGFGANHDTLHTCCRFYSCLARCILISLVLIAHSIINVWATARLFAAPPPTAEQTDVFIHEKCRQKEISAILRHMKRTLSM